MRTTSLSPWCPSQINHWCRAPSLRHSQSFHHWNKPQQKIAWSLPNWPFLGTMIESTEADKLQVFGITDLLWTLGSLPWSWAMAQRWPSGFHWWPPSECRQRPWLFIAHTVFICSHLQPIQWIVPAGMDVLWTHSNHFSWPELGWLPPEISYHQCGIHLYHRVPQGRILHPRSLQPLINTLWINHLPFWVGFHQYADHFQLCISPSKSPSSVAEVPNPCLPAGDEYWCEQTETKSWQEKNNAGW